MQEVEAIKSEEQRQQVEAHLADRGQIYLDIWKIGLNVNAGEKARIFAASIVEC